MDKEKQLRALTLETLSFFAVIISVFFTLIHITAPNVKILWSHGYAWTALSLITFIMFVFLWMIALLSPQRNNHLKWLSEQKTTSAYSQVLKIVLQRIDEIFSKDIKLSVLSTEHYWSVSLLRFTLLFAVIFPILLVLVQWMFSGTDTVIASITLFKAVTAEWQQTLSGLLLMAGSYFFYLGIKESDNTLSFHFIYTSVVTILSIIAFAATGNKTVLWVPLITTITLLITFLVMRSFGTRSNEFFFTIPLILSITFVGAVLGVNIVTMGVGKVAITITGVVTGTGTLVSAFSGALIGAFDSEGAGAFAFAIVIIYIAEWRLKNQSLIRLFILIAAYFIALIIVVSFNTVESELSRSSLLFLGFLPLIYALFDYFSISVTRYLLQNSIHSKYPLLRGIVGAIVSVILFLLLKLSLITLFVLLVDSNGTQLLSLIGDQGLLHSIKQHPENYIWLYFTLFSIFIPTVIHLNIACFSIITSSSPALIKLVETIVKSLKSPNSAWLKSVVAFIALCTISTITYPI